jgi:hypothetical protein
LHINNQNEYVFTGVDYDNTGKRICTCNFTEVGTSGRGGCFFYKGDVTMCDPLSNPPWFTNIGAFIDRGNDKGNGYFVNISPPVSLIASSLSPLPLSSTDERDTDIIGQYRAYKITNKEIAVILKKAVPQTMGDEDYDKVAAALWSDKKDKPS